MPVNIETEDAQGRPLTLGPKTKSTFEQTLEEFKARLEAQETASLGDKPVLIAIHLEISLGNQGVKDHLNFSGKRSRLRIGVIHRCRHVLAADLTGHLAADLAADGAIGIALAGESLRPGGEPPDDKIFAIDGRT